MLDGGRCSSVPLVPLGGVEVKFTHVLWTFAIQTTTKKVGEEAMVTVPNSFVVESDDEEVLPLQSLQHFVSVVAPGEGIAERACEAIQDRGLWQECPHVIGLAFEHLLGQKVQHISVAAGERFDEAGDVFAVAHRESRKLQTGDPTLRGLLQRRDFFGGEVKVHYASQERHRLLLGEGQLGSPDLGYLSPGAKPRERQRRIDAARNDEVGVLREVFQQERDDPVDGLGIDQIIVVENYGDLSREIGHLIDESTRQRLQPRGLRRPKRGQYTLPEFLIDAPPERGHEIREKAGRVVIPLVQGEPDDRTFSLLAAFQPLVQQRGLAETGGGGDERQLATRISHQGLDQARTRHHLRACLRGVQLGRYERLRRKRHLLAHLLYLF